MTKSKSKITMTAKKKYKPTLTLTPKKFFKGSPFGKKIA